MASEQHPQQQQNKNPEQLTQYWQQQINAWSQTEQSGAEFCQHQGLIYHQFIYWRQKLTQPSPSKPQRLPSSGSGFSQVAYPAAAPGGLSLLLPNGIEMRGVDTSNLAVVQALLAAL